MIRVLKYLAAFIATLTIATGVYFYFSFTNIHFLIKNKRSEPITAQITLHSKAKDKDYTYPLLGDEVIPEKSDVESFYTVDKSTDGTVCVAVEFKNKGDKIILKVSCPKEGDTVIVE